MPHDPAGEDAPVDSGVAPRLQVVAGGKAQEEAPASARIAPRQPEGKSRPIFLYWRVLVCVVVAVAGAVFWFQTRPVPGIALEIRPGDSLIIKGLVLYRGQPVDSGKIQLIVTDAKTTYHLASLVRDVKAGEFSTETAPAVALTNLEGYRQLRINAHFWGRAAAAEGGHAEALEAETTVFSNCSSPIMREDVTRALIAFGLLASAVIVLYTMELTPLWAPILFGASYLATFLSVTLPLVLIVYVSQNPYLMEIMRDSPIGLVRARTQAITSDAQWLLNVGGLVTSVPTPEETVSSAEGAEVPATDLSEPNAGEAISAPAPAALAEATGAAEADGTVPEVGAAAADPLLPNRAASEKEPLSPQALMVTGGLAIPFYVIILAVFGAGINMMRRIPAIQSKHMRRLQTAPTQAATVLRAQALSNTDASCDTRQEVIAQHMYLLAAPFLAIAVYYLLQILAKDIAQPVIVLMAFSTGLISEKIVAQVIGVAERTLGGNEGEGEEANGQGAKHRDTPA